MGATYAFDYPERLNQALSPETVASPDISASGGDAMPDCQFKRSNSVKYNARYKLQSYRRARWSLGKLFLSMIVTDVTIHRDLDAMTLSNWASRCLERPLELWFDNSIDRYLIIGAHYKVAVSDTLADRYCPSEGKTRANPQFENPLLPMAKCH